MPLLSGSVLMKSLLKFSPRSYRTTPLPLSRAGPAEFPGGGGEEGGRPKNNPRETLEMLEEAADF